MSQLSKPAQSTWRALDCPTEAPTYHPVSPRACAMLMAGAAITAAPNIAAISALSLVMRRSWRSVSTLRPAFCAKKKRAAEPPFPGKACCDLLEAVNEAYAEHVE